MTIEVKVPDIGDFKNIPVIEILVREGDSVQAEDPLVTLESDKATMEVPSPRAGVIKKIHIQLGDRVSEGSLLLVLEDAAAGATIPAATATAATTQPSASGAEPHLGQAHPTPPPAPTPAATNVHPVAPSASPGPVVDSGAVIAVTVPDIGDFKNIPVIEILVKAGQSVNLEDPLITLESDKATMEVPSPAAGVVQELCLAVGDRVSEGSLILRLTGAAAASAAQAAGNGAAAHLPAAPGFAALTHAPQGQAPQAEVAAPAVAQAVAPASTPAPVAPETASSTSSEAMIQAHASPVIRRFARELGVDLGRVKGSGPKGRIVREDVQAFVKSLIQSAAAPATGVPAAGIGLGLLPWPQVDFAKYGPIEAQPLSRIKKISGANLHRNWVMIPHVTNHDDADITDLESFRVQLNQENAKAGTKVTLLAFLIKAVCNTLRKFPEFNASLDGDSLVLKHYYHIGFAADTPNGLVVPVIRDADKKGVLQIAAEASALAAKARDGKLGPADMQGGTFSISSLGGIGGTYFTPIINAPEVAILGVCKATLRPVWKDQGFQPRLIAPLSLSYDHRVIDGASAARFNNHLIGLLGDMRRATL